MSNISYEVPFEKGRLYNRRAAIHAVFGGQRQGGIATPTDSSLIFLFTGESGEQHGYSDGWDEDGVFHYFGEGQHGDMEFVRGNRAIRDHAENGKELLLFQLLGKSRPVRFLGLFSCASWEFVDAPDTDNVERRAIVFHLIPDGAFEEFEEDTVKVHAIDLKVLRNRALSAATSHESKAGKEGKRTYYKRSKAVRDYVLARATGKCECCGDPAPFTRKNGSAYLEPHHIKRRSDFGPDHPRWVAGICPNCHREIHFGIHGDERNAQLAEKIGAVEDVQGPSLAS